MVLFLLFYFPRFFLAWDTHCFFNVKKILSIVKHKQKENKRLYVYSF